MLFEPYVTRAAVTELTVQKAAEAALAVVSNPARALLRQQMAAGPAMGPPSGGNYDEEGNWHEFFRLDHSALDGPDILYSSEV